MSICRRSRTSVLRSQVPDISSTISLNSEQNHPQFHIVLGTSLYNSNQIVTFNSTVADYFTTMITTCLSSGVEYSSALVQWFWEILETFSPSERSLFLRFVWGRTRLPRNIADFRGRDFVLQVRSQIQQLFTICVTSSFRSSFPWLARNMVRILLND